MERSRSKVLVCQMFRTVGLFKSGGYLYFGAPFDLDVGKYEC